MLSFLDDNYNLTLITGIHSRCVCECVFVWLELCDCVWDRVAVCLRQPIPKTGVFSDRGLREWKVCRSGLWGWGGTE